MLRRSLAASSTSRSILVNYPRCSPSLSPSPKPRHRPSRSYTTPPSSGRSSKPSPSTAPKPKPKPIPLIVKTSGTKPRHEVQEGTEALNIPFNAPGVGNQGPQAGPAGMDVFEVTKSPLFNAALTTFLGVGVVFLGGVLYVSWYKRNVLNKMEGAFAPGYDPALELASHSSKVSITGDELDEVPSEQDGPWTEHLRRKEQEWIDRIIHGKEPGHYFVLLGPKGSGKATMILDAMKSIQADGVAMCDAHPDLEVFRLRLGKALNFEYHEDSQTGLFQRRDPREGGPALDIERALNKLEKVALRSYQKRRKPLVLVLNNIHFFQNDDEGKNMLLQLQQRAEAWAASGILTMVFTSDDAWPFFLMRKTGSRMHVRSVTDLSTNEALCALARMRANAKKKGEDVDCMKAAVSLVGGRLAYLTKVAKSRDITEISNLMLRNEKAWLQSQVGLIPDCDDDVMDEQKWSSCSWLLLREFVKIRQEQERERDELIKAGNDDQEGLQDIAQDLPLPVIPYWRCRQIMTRPDFLEDLDRANIIQIDVHHDVRPDSMLILQAAREVVEEEDFDEVLESVRDRVDEIESLHRTRELTFKDIDKGDRIYLSVTKDGLRGEDT